MKERCLAEVQRLESGTKFFTETDSVHYERQNNVILCTTENCCDG